MDWFRRTNGLALAALMFFLGCVAPADPYRPPVATTPRQPPVADPHAVDRVVREVAKAESLDTAGQTRLADELRRAEPALWPAVVQSFRTTLAYQREAQRREAGPEKPAPTVVAASPEPAVAGEPGAKAPAAQPIVATAPSCEKHDISLLGAPLLEGPDEKVLPASYTANSTSPWQQQLALSITALERDLGDEPAGDLTFDRETRLRLLYLAAGRRDDALRAMAAAPGVQEFWRNELYGLSVYMDAAKNPDPARRAGEAKEHFGAAVTGLAQTAPLALKNLAFATEVQSFGVLKPFVKCDFAPNQVVLLYVEVENFASEEDKAGFHTTLEGSYRIFDNRNQQVAEQQLGKTEDLCRNRRRDFFLCYYLHIPKRIYDGKHTLQLTVVDPRSKKATQSQIEFTVKGD